MNIISHGHSADSNTPAEHGELNQDVDSIREQLSKFELGKFLLDNLGLNGRWTSYILLHPNNGRLTRLSSDNTPMGELESWLLDRCPILLATQERFRIFKKITQAKIATSMELASIPCGKMDDLLSLDYSGFDGVRVTGVDLDKDSLAHAQVNFDRLKPKISVSFECKDAWTLSFTQHWDLITSNGLNIYVDDDQRCTDLYKSFSASLKPNGYLVASYITPPSEWQPNSDADLARQKLIFTQAVPVKWQCVRTEEKTRLQLDAAGFEVETIVYDTQRMFPSVLARKR